MIREISKETTSDERKTGESIRQSNRNSKISEWLKPQEDKTEEQVPEIKENTYIKYYIIGTTILVFTCLGWVYWEDIKTGGNSFLDWLFSSRPGGPSNPTTDNNSNPTTDSGGSTTPVQPNISRSINSPRTNSPDIQLIDRSFTSPSLEDLNEKARDEWSSTPTSPTGSTSSNSSTSSIETIKGKSKEIIDTSTSDLITPSTSILENSSFIEKIDSLLKSGERIEKIVDDHWKFLLKKDVRLAITYVEEHFPKNDLIDTTYINKLINDVKTENMNFSREILSLRNKMTLAQVKAGNNLATKTELWVEEIEQKLRNLD